jgi:hypothetical protein
MVWERWKKDGIHSRFITWLTLHRLAEHFLKLCKEQDRDYREYDFYTLIDSNLYFEENRAEIENILGGLESDRESAAVNKLKDYLTEEQLKEYLPEERTKIEEIEASNQNLNKKLNQITKKISAQDTQTIDSQEIREGLKRVQDQQCSIIAKLANLPNLEQQINALQESSIFRDLGKELKPLLQQPQPPQPIVKKQNKYGFLKSLFPDFKSHLLDYFAGAMVFVMWLGFSWGILENYGLTWPVTAALGLLWIVFVVVFRVVAGGILD